MPASYVCRLIAGNRLNHTCVEQVICKAGQRCMAKVSTDGVSIEKWKRDGVYIDKRGKLRTFNHKKLSRKRCNLLASLVLFGEVDCL